MRTSQNRRGRRAALVAATLGLACAPAATRAQVLFSDNFDADSTSRYNVFSFDNSVSTTNVVAGTGSNDVAITPAFNYSAYTYRYTNSDEVTDYATIPQAPRTTTGNSLGLRLDVNNTSVGGTGTAIINLLPKVTEFTGGVLPSGNYKLTVDVWVNYNGPATGGAGSTEYMIVGLNQQNPGPSNGLAGPVVTNPTIQQRGSAIAIDGETGSGTDYRIFTDNSRLGDFNATTGYAAPITAAVSGSNGEQNPYYNTLFPFPTYESVGGIGKHWITLEAKYQDGVVYYSIDSHIGLGMQLIAANTIRTSTSGNVALGYADLNSGVAALENSGPIVNTDASFVIYDNLVVEQLTASTPASSWTAASGTWGSGSNWANGTPNSSTAVASFGAGAAGATVTVGSSASAREIVFDNSGMTIGGSGPLVMDSPGATGGDSAVFTVKQGTHTVSAPVTVNKSILFHVEDGASLTFSQPLSDSTNGFTKSGGGTVNLRGGRNGGLTVLGGTINLVPGSGTMAVTNFLIVGSLAAQRGSIDLNDNRMIYDYFSDATATFTTNQYINIRDTIGGAYHAGAWDRAGLISSLVVNDPNKIKGIGYWPSSVLLGLSGSDTANWYGQTADATSFLIAVTYLGDLNYDGKVDGDDFVLMDRGFSLYLVSTAVDPRGIAASRAQWWQGDLNYDGAITAADYAIIDKTFGILHPGGLNPDFLAMREAQFGSEYVSSLLASVPEPGTLGLAAVAAGACLGGRRRRHLA